jgi:hypothetical protein
MRSSNRLRGVFAAVAMLCVCLLGAPMPGQAQGHLDADARRVLSELITSLNGLERFSVEYSAVDEVVTPEGEKLQFLHSGVITVQRPDRVYAQRRGAAGAAELFFNGQTVSMFGQEAQAYLQLPASSIVAAVDAVRALGFDAPGADLILPNPFDDATTDLRAGVHVGMTFIDGVEVHHLAFRGQEVDWQIWVTAGARALPLRYVITTTTLPSRPQYTLQLRNWNVAPQIAAGRFEFTPPPGARRVEPSAVTVSPIGDMILRTQ